MKNISFSIAVDGSSASGKTTGSKFISKKFNFKFLSSGKLYRYLSYKIIKNNYIYNQSFIRKQSKKITLKKLNNKKLYSPEVTSLASIIAKKKFVRSSLKQFQKNFIKKNKKVIIEGRDIASKIMPNADLKIYFKCSVKEKAKRRLKDFKKNNKKINYIYKLTPKGISEKTKLTLIFMKRKMVEYDELKKEIDKDQAKY